MARGWESKSVEAQRELREAAGRQVRREPAPEQAERQSRRQGIELSRTRIANEMAAATHPRRIEQLRLAMAHLDRQLADLDA
jgi:hypothetical protein